MLEAQELRQESLAGANRILGTLDVLRLVLEDLWNKREEDNAEDITSRVQDQD